MQGCGLYLHSCRLGNDMNHSWPVKGWLHSAGLRSLPPEKAPSCLIAEDAALISMTLESDFECQGFACASVCSSADALRWLDANTPSVAILDYLLRDGPCTMLAGVLRARGVPFLIYSGFPAQAACPELRETMWITKPADRHTLVGAVSSLVASQP